MLVTERRPKQDWAPAIQAVVDGHYPTAERLVVVLENRTRHGRWLTIAEIERSLLSRQWLDRRSPDPADRDPAVTVWTVERTAHQRTVDGRFTTAAAPIKLQRLSSSF